MPEAEVQGCPFFKNRQLPSRDPSGAADIIDIIDVVCFVAFSALVKFHAPNSRLSVPPSNGWRRLVLPATRGKKILR